MKKLTIPQLLAIHAAAHASAQGFSNEYSREAAATAIDEVQAELESRTTPKPSKATKAAKTEEPAADADSAPQA